MAEQKVVLLGDSILDNAPYTEPEPDTAAHLRRILGAAGSVDLRARDGATMADVPRQLERTADRGATAVLSIGGNDATAHIGILARPASDSAAVIGDLLEIADDFGRRYEEVARTVAAHYQRTVLCTIYEVQLEPAPLARLARVPLALLNDRIIRTAGLLGLEVLELREVCTAPSDFVLQIEPSATGAAKIAQAIAGLLEPGPSARSTRIHRPPRQPLGDGSATFRPAPS